MPKGSLDIDSFSLSNAVRSVSFPKLDEADMFELKRRNMSRFVDKNEPIMVEGQKTRLLNCKLFDLTWLV